MSKDLTSTVTTKGQVTIPVSIRKKLELHPGSIVHFTVREDHATLHLSGWPAKINEVHDTVAAYNHHHHIGHLTDEELNKAIDEAAQNAATERYQRTRS